MIIPPRLGQLLSILLQEAQPVSVDTLAGRLGSSRRTVFRELKNVDSLLAPYGQRIQTIIGKGLVLEGNDDGKKLLRLELDAASNETPLLNMDKRLTLLEIALLDANGVQKLYYFARHLNVSEATVSNDLGRLEDRIASFNLELERKPGKGVELRGEERDFRRMLLSIIMSDGGTSPCKQLGYPAMDVEQGVIQVMQNRLAPHMDWMTQESLQMLTKALMVSVDRVQKNRLLATPPKRINGMPRHLADMICDTLETQFGIIYPISERVYVEQHVSAGRAKQHSPLDPGDASDYSKMQSLAYKLIDRFDAKLSHTLKLNDDLVQGLTLHLWSALVRMQNHIELDASIIRQIENEFPELIEKCRGAVQVLAEDYGIAVPDNELAYIASYFGAAMLHLGERTTRHRLPRAGLVCVSGIGVSYMMASQLRNRFKGLLEVEICDWYSEDEWRLNDMLISTIPLEYTERPMVQVQPILTSEDYRNIQLVLDELINQPVMRFNNDEQDSLLSQLETADRRIQQIKAMLAGFGCNYIHPDCTFEELAQYTGYRYGTTSASGSSIYQALLRRESMGTQVIDQLGIVLLHSRTDGVSDPVVGLIAPEGGAFLDPVFKGAKACMVLLMPSDGDRGLGEIMGRLSSALVEDEVFLSAVQNADTNVVLIRIESVMKDYIWEHLI